METTSADEATSLVVLPDKSSTLYDLAATLHRNTEALADPDFDPEKVIGDIRNKVDALQYIDGHMEATAKWLETEADKLLKKAKAILNNRKRLNKYIQATMEASSFLRLPGNVYRVELIDNPPAATPARVAEALDFIKWPEYVKKTIEYSWKKNDIKAAAKKGEKLPDDMPVKITRGKTIEFNINVPENLQRKGKKNGRTADSKTTTEGGRQLVAGLPAQADHGGAPQTFEPGPLHPNCPDGNPEESAAR